MRFSPLLLYRKTAWAVIPGVMVLVLVQTVAGQLARKETRSSGPRALALVELSPQGQARLIPVAIMVDGKFYDASAYKADPVPMALDSGTVYEGEKSGASQGLFTVKQALQLKDSWQGVGQWQSAEALAAAAAKKKAPPAKHSDDEMEGPPKLRRGGAEPAKPATPASTASTPPSSAPAPGPGQAPAASPVPATAAPPATASNPENTEHPTLKRGRPSTPFQGEEPGKPPATGAKPPAKSTAPVMQVFPAISDAGGPEPVSYAYSMQPEEEQQFRKRMLALAADELHGYIKTLSTETIPAEPVRPARGKAAAKPAGPSFDDVQLRVFDLTNSNEPILILTATARMPAAPDVRYYVSLVARNDIYGDLHKASAVITDNQHLDVTSRRELIDAVDADGDGRGELFFRQVSDAGSAYEVDRGIGDQLYVLFQGKVGE